MKRPRLGVEIAVALAVKAALLTAIWARWFAHPVSRELDGRGVAAALLGNAHAPSPGAEAPADARR